MKRSLNLFRPLILVLLVFQASFAHALPEGIHLNLCFGPDGRFEISPDLCPDGLTCQQIDPDEFFIAADDPHGDCLDFELGCIATGEFRPTTSLKSPGKNRFSKSLANAAGSPIFLFASWILPPTDPTRPDLPAEFSPYTQISSLRTIVLQI
ncbi:MAG: hypothetical protein KKG47_06385 [Proteobacteria bacterium]|nr:hypothetical protein [Pseudomonadota bacterium]MBU1739800.1 hypothetical protein [Pseudomonadota bacterium]